MAKGEGDRPFPTRSPLHFYCGMLGRYRRYLAGLALFTVIFAGLSTLRLVSIGLVLDSVKIRLGGEDDGGEGLRPNAGGGDTVKTLDKIKEWLLPGQFPPLEETLRSQEGFENFVLATVVALCLLALALGVTLFIKDTLTIKMVARVLVETRQVLFNHLTRQPVSFFHDRRAGDLISRVTNDVEMLHIALTHLFQTLLQQPVLALWSLGLAFWASPFLFMVSIPMFVLMVIPVFRAARKIVRHGRRRQQKLGMITEALQQLFGGIRTVKAFGMEKHERQAFEEKNRGFGRALRKMAQARITGRAFQESFYNLGLAGLFLLGGWLLTSETDRLSVGRFFIFILAMIQVYTPVKAATKAYNKVQEARAGVERVLEILRTPPALTDREGARDFPGLRERIRFENVSFSYDAQPRSRPDHDTATSVPAAETDGRAALEEIDLEVEKGQVLALVGPSGAGKSTVVDLVARFYEPQSGVIRVDGVDVREYRHESYLERIGIVSQDPFLFNATIRENIRYGLEGAS
ncbi:MAG: ABC transporter ATP-binding protein, partial [Planctomycetota bacterium]|nr:ABC transporter ATP-binding protein [Planctomycetota bacterium]